MRNLEQELKLRLDEREYGILSQLTQAEPQLQINYYFAYRQMPRDEMVRVRKKGDAYTLCYKKRLADIDGVNVCDERESKLETVHAQYILTRGLTVDEMRKLCGVAVPEQLRLLGSMETFRTRFVWNEWTLELDKNVYLGATDYELESENGDASRLDGLKNRLYYDFGIRSKPSLPKIERFLNRLKQ